MILLLTQYPGFWFLNLQIDQIVTVPVGEA